MPSAIAPKPRSVDVPHEVCRHDDCAHFSFGLVQADVEEFRDIIRNECGEELGQQGAWQRAIEALALFRMLLGPLPDDPTEASYPQA